ncbi:hypothetical protein [Halorussus halophilus]|uniref:hypothetical protein n=1 Tax=Halorussus halophilus TaxID=2650975 RepID=UPI0013012DC7|nr:hypothetical protein [Halorussus halophilus]
MATFVERVQVVGSESTVEFDQLLASRIEAVGTAISIIEDWLDSSVDERTELLSKFEMVKQFARSEIQATTNESDVMELSATALLDHPAVSEQSKANLREYSTKLAVFIDEEQSYRDAREQIMDDVTAELELYTDLLDEMALGTVTVADAQAQIARFAHHESVGPSNKTAVDIVLESTTDE